jgi:hypothetical protein
MTPQEQAQVVMKACGVEPGHPFQQVNAATIPAAIRAAVDLVLPEERRLCDRSRRRMVRRAEFLAIVAALEAPANG